MSRSSEDSEDLKALYLVVLILIFGVCCFKWGSYLGAEEVKQQQLIVLPTPYKQSIEAIEDRAKQVFDEGVTVEEQLRLEYIVWGEAQQ